MFIIHCTEAVPATARVHATCHETRFFFSILLNRGFCIESFKVLFHGTYQPYTMQYKIDFKVIIQRHPLSINMLF